jgi:hypothetical protein
MVPGRDVHLGEFRLDLRPSPRVITLYWSRGLGREVSADDLLEFAYISVGGV